MTVYGFLSLVYDDEKDPKARARDLAVVVGMTAWALLGNYICNGSAGEYSRFFNRFFVVRDPFGALPEKISLFVMPFVNIALFFAVEAILTLAFRCEKRGKS